MGWRSSQHGHGLGLQQSSCSSVLCHVCRTLSVNASLDIFCIFLTIVQEIHGYGTTRATFERTTGAPIKYIRLVGGYDEYEGVVEVFVDGEWGAICDDNFGQDEANIVCRQVAFYYGEAEDYFTYAASKYDTYPYDTIFYNNLNCEGYESSLKNCAYTTTRDYSCYSGYNVAGVRCKADDGKSDESPFEGVLGYLTFFVFIIVIVGVVATRRYRQRRSLCGNNVPGNQTQVVYNGNSAQGIVIPPPRATSHQVPPGSYPTQQQPYQYSSAADLPPQYNIVVQPQGNPGVPPSSGSPPYPPPYPEQAGGTPYPPQGGAPYPPQGGTTYPPAQPYPQTTPYPSAPPPTNPAYPPPDNTTSPAFPPTDYTPVTNDSTPQMPPPSYDSLAT